MYDVSVAQADYDCCKKVAEVSSNSSVKRHQTSMLENVFTCCLLMWLAIELAKMLTGQILDHQELSTGHHIMHNQTLSFKLHSSKLEGSLRHIGYPWVPRY